MKKIKESMPPSKKMVGPGKKVAGRKYPIAEEDFEKMERKKVKRTNSLAKDLMKAKEGYSKEPRVKPDKKRAMK